MAASRRSGRVRRSKGRYEPETGNTVAASAAETNYFAQLTELDNDEVEQELALASLVRSELSCVGAGVGGGFASTEELKPMKYDQAINGPDGEAWKEEIEHEYERMEKHGVFQAIDRSDLPPGVKPIDSTWACKKKSNGKLRGRLNARGFKQKEGVHYDGDSISAPVTNEVTIRILLVLMVMAGMVMVGRVVDVQGAFLHGEFEDGETIYMEVPQGFERHYPTGAVLKLCKTIYGLKQSARWPSTGRW